MGSPQTAVAPSPADTPRYHRVTPEQRKIMRDLRKLNTPQTAIAQALGVSQSTVSKWLSELEDTTADATEYLKSKALRMAENIVKKGRAADHIAALKGVGVLAQEQVSGVTIQIGIKDSDVLLDLGTGNITTYTAPALAQVTPSQQLTITGSDKGSSVNPQDPS